jgi:hypothetical protein
MSGKERKKEVGERREAEERRRERDDTEARQ